eukprot:1773720-Rhodomonas_salina.1
MAGKGEGSGRRAQSFGLRVSTLRGIASRPATGSRFSYCGSGMWRYTSATSLFFFVFGPCLFASSSCLFIVKRRNPSTAPWQRSASAAETNATDPRRICFVFRVSWSVSRVLSFEGFGFSIQKFGMGIRD